MSLTELEHVIYQLPDELIRWQCTSGTLVGDLEKVQIPDQTTETMAAEHYHGYRHVKVGACADVLVWTYSGGVPAVILTQRKKNSCFGGKWWVQGGAIGKAISCTDFVAQCALKECGSLPKIQALVGIYRTTDPGAGDQQMVSTIQVAYFGFVEPAKVILSPDEHHAEVALMTKDEYRSLPEEQKHWYPTCLIETLFRTMS